MDGHPDAHADGRQRFQRLAKRLNAHVVGQHGLVERLVVALLANGHLLVEGAPGLAKTRAVKSLAQGLDASFQRIQFTPDLLPSDVTGTDVWLPQRGVFEFQPGPLFNSVLLADEINRAPAKVQSALLEAMAERQVTVGGATRPLPRLFLVMATQNPIEQEGTYPLPEAQLDRFMMHVRVDWPAPEHELEILRLARAEARSPEPDASTPDGSAPLSAHEVMVARQQVLDLHLAPQLERYIVELVLASRDASRVGGELEGRVAWGASPRATIALERCARALAWLDGRDFVAPEDVRAVAPDVLRHRIIPSYEAAAEGWDGQRIVEVLLDRVPLP